MTAAPGRSAAGSLEASGLRSQVASAARRFKAGWGELAQLLVRVREGSKHQEWGYSSFEEYCLKELHLRRQTALKLTRGYALLERHDRSRVQSDEFARSAPPFELVQVLADAEERGQLSAEEYRKVRDSIWTPDRPMSALRRELTDRFPKPIADGPSSLARLAAMAKRVADAAAQTDGVSVPIVQRAAALAEELAALVDS